MLPICWANCILPRGKSQMKTMNVMNVKKKIKYNKNGILHISMSRIWLYSYRNPVKFGNKRKK